MAWRKISRRVAAAALALALAGILYEKIGEHRDRNRYPRIGRAVDIGGRTLNIYCSGEGSPAVVFEGAGHTAGYAFAEMQAEVAKFTTSCWYDRAGYGWSDPGPSPRTFQAIATDLHSLLHTAGVPAPYVLVGAGASAFHVRVFHSMYPSEVAGAVLIHADDPDVFSHEPEYMQGKLAALPPVVQQIGCRVLEPTLQRLGVLRFLGNPGAGQPFGLAYLGPQQQRELTFLSTNPSTAQTEGEGCVLDRSMAEVRASGDFGNLPLFVLCNSTPFQAPGPQFVKETDDLNHYWFHELQPRLAAMSSHGHLVIDSNAETPPSIVGAIRQVVTSTGSATR